MKNTILTRPLHIVATGTSFGSRPNTLYNIQKHPENYRDLVVRVAGYSAFYTELSAEVQQQIILRTEYQGV